MNIEHCDCLSWFSRKCESQEQDGETLSPRLRCGVDQRPAILPWLSDLLGCGRATPRPTNRQLCCRAMAGALCAPPYARPFSRVKFSTADAKSLHQNLVAGRLGTPPTNPDLHAVRPPPPP